MTIASPKLTLLLTFLLLTFGLHAQKHKPKNDLEDKEFFGKVKSVNETEFDGLDSTSVLSRALFRFNTKGNFTEVVSYTSSGILSYRMIYLYDSNENISREKRFIADENNNEIPEYDYHYFYKNALAPYQEQHFVMDESGNPKLDETYFYSFDDKTNLTEMKVVDAEGKQIRRSELTYDSAGNIIKILAYDGENKFREKEVSAYDKNNNLIEYRSYDENGKSTSTYLVSYNSKNQRIEWKSLDSLGVVTLRNTFVYDDHKMMIEQNVFDTANKSDWQKTYSYVYDKEGNWIKKLVFKNHSRQEIIQREISFY